MINISKVKKYCKDYTKIENYDKAIADKSQTWVCHHRKEELGYSQSELKSMEEYFDVPADDLIFMTKSEHRRLHMIGKKLTDETKKKIGIAHTGKKLTAETKQKLSVALTGENNSMYGKKHKDETRARISEAQKGKPKPKYKWLTPSGEIVEMCKTPVVRWHKDWILIE